MQQILTKTGTFWLISGMFAVGLADPANAADARYEIDWHGLSIGEFDMSFESGESQYKVSYEARSTGILALVFPFNSRGYSSGLIADGEIIATSHSAISNVRGKPRSWNVGFDLDGSVAFLDVQEDDERDPVPAKLQQAPDPLGLALSALKDAAPGSQLQGQSFDGRRSVKLNMNCGEQTDTDLLRCEVEGELQAGASQRWRNEHGDEPPVRRPVNITLARNVIGEDWWPIEMSVESRYGPVRVRLITPDKG